MINAISMYQPPHKHYSLAAEQAFRDFALFCDCNSAREITDERAISEARKIAKRIGAHICQPTDNSIHFYGNGTTAEEVKKNYFKKATD